MPKSHSETTLITLNKDELREIIEYLSQYHDVNPEQLSADNEIVTKFNLLRLTVSLLKDKQDHSHYNFISEIIEKQFRPTIIKEGTIGAYLFGCYQHDYGDVDEHCAITCLKSFHPSINRDSCTRQIWIQRTDQIDQSSRFTLYHNGLSHELQSSSINQRILPYRATIFVKSNWLGFTSAELQLLKEYNVEEADIMIKDTNRYNRILPWTRLHKLPISPENVTPISPSQPITISQLSNNDLIQNKLWPIGNHKKGSSPQFYPTNHQTTMVHPTKSTQPLNSNYWTSTSIIVITVILLLIIIGLFIWYHQSTNQLWKY